MYPVHYKGSYEVLKLKSVSFFRAFDKMNFYDLLVQSYVHKTEYIYESLLLSHGNQVQRCQ